MTTHELPSPEVLLWNAIEALAEAIGARNQIQGHSVRVACYAVRFGEALGFSPEQLREIRLGALLHDIGQIFWPDQLLQKRGTPLTSTEKKIIESHTVKGCELIEAWPCLQIVRPYILYHQEWVDGSGYPYGLRGDALPICVQVVSLADVYEALRHPRAYRARSGYSHNEAITQMQPMREKRWSGRLFDLFVAASSRWEGSGEVNARYETH